MATADAIVKKIIAGISGGTALIGIQFSASYLPALAGTDVPINFALLVGLTIVVATLGGLLSAIHPWVCGLALVLLSVPGFSIPNIGAGLICGTLVPVLAQRLRPSVVVLVLGLGHLAWRIPKQPVPTETHEDPRPDIVLVVLDTVSASRTSLHGFELETTPNLDALAAAGAWFVRAQSPAPWTMPAHAAMFTGQDPRDVGVHHEHLTLSATVPTTAELLTDAGYQTGAFLANPWLRRESGLTRGFSHTEGLWEIIDANRSFSILNLVNAKPGKGGAALVRRGLDFLRTQTQPSFVVFNLLEPHAPYHMTPNAQYFGAENPAEVSARVLAQQALGPDANSYPETGELEAAMRVHAAGIRDVDALLGEIWHALQARSRASVLIVTSDHGEGFGEHDIHGHIVGLWPETLHVPLVVVAPGIIEPNTIIHEAVSTKQVHGTILSMASQPSGPGLFDPSGSRPISEHFRPLVFLNRFGGRARHPQFDVEASKIHGETHTLLVSKDANNQATWQCFDIRTDPMERTPLPVTECDRTLQTDLMAHRQRPTPRENPSLPMHAQEQLRALGYIE